MKKNADKNFFRFCLRLFVLLLVFLNASVLSACDGKEIIKPEYEKTAQVSVSLNEVIGEVSPYIYGQFIEHIEDCIYDGIWAEMILDRKFYYEVGHAGFSPWKTEHASKVEMTQEKTYSGAYAAKVESGGNIYQENISLVKGKEYTGYFYARTLGGEAEITVSLTTGAGTEVVTVKASGEEFTKYEYSLTGNADTMRAKYQISVSGATCVLDSISMMPADNYYGMRIDTLELLKELGGTIYRWPGGNFLSGYDWKDGIGDRDKREPKRNLHYMQPEDSFESDAARESSDIVNIARLGFYGAIEPNDFGLDEFMKLCEFLGCEVMMMVNTGLGSVEDAGDLVEYCNGGTDTEYGRLRAENGRAEPYGIKYWGVGNEMFGSWQLGHVGIDEYKHRHNRFVEAMRAVDPTIEIIAVGENVSDWTAKMIEECHDRMDYSAEHMYALRDEVDVYKHLANVKNNLSDRIKAHRDLQKKYAHLGAENIYMAMTEYAYADVMCESRLKDGLGIGIYLNMFINNADVVKFACYSSTVNATQGCVTTTHTAAVMQGAGYALKLYRKNMEKIAVRSFVKMDRELQLDVSATVSPDRKKLTLAVVNPSQFSVRINCNLLDGKIINKRHTFTGDFYESFNSPLKQELYEVISENEAYPVAPAISITIFEVDLK